MTSSEHPGSILLVEDNEVEAMMVVRACQSTALNAQINVVDDGSKALAYLRRQDPYQQAAAVNLVLLDLNLPGVDGYGVLRQMRADPALAPIPVIVLTSSSLRQDIVDSYQSGAAAFVTKPVGIAGFEKVMGAIEAFWLDVAIFP